MEFLNPFFWLGAGALTAPILIHLVRRHRRERVPFPSLMFLRKIPTKELRRKKLTNLFLLFLRCLGLLLIVAAFSRPMVLGTWFGSLAMGTPRSLVILIDSSMSMSREPVWQRASEVAERRVRSLTGGDEGLIVRFGETVEVLSSWEARSERLLSVLHSRAETSFEGTSYGEALRVASEQFKEQQANSRKEIVLITDLQLSGLPESQKWRLPGDVLLTIESVGEESSNLFVEEVRLERFSFGERHPYPIVTVLRSTPPQPLKGELQLFLEGQLIDRRGFELNQDGTAQVTFRPFALEAGPRKGRIVAQVEDGFPADNVFFFVVERRESRPITVVSSRPSSMVYLKSALSSGQNLPFRVEVVKPPGPARLNSEDRPVLILDDLARPPRPAALESYVSNGGGLLISLGNSVRPQAYHRLAAELFPVELDQRRFIRSRDRNFTSITDVDWQHPVFSVFRESHRAGLVSVQFYSYWKLLPRQGSTVLARFDESSPALVESALGRGRVLVFASSLDRVWTDFPLRNAYVPFWHRLAGYAGGWSASAAARTVGEILGSERDATKSESGRTSSWNIVDPNGQRVIGLDQETPDFVELKFPGHYEIRKNKETDWVAVNSDPRESDLEQVPVEKLLARFRAEQPTSSSPPQAKGVSHTEHRQPLWWLLLLAAALVLGVESLVANHRRRVVE